MKKIVKLTPDHLLLIKNLRLRHLNPEVFGIDMFSAFGGDYMNQDMAMILGYGNRIIPDTIGNPLGPVYEEEIETYLTTLAADFDEHLEDYFELMQQFCDQGGLKPGVYSRTTDNIIWKYEGDKEVEDDYDKPELTDGKWDALAGME